MTTRGRPHNVPCGHHSEQSTRPRPTTRTIASHLDLDKDRLDRIYRRRRLGVLSAIALVVVGVGLVVQPGEADTAVAAGDARVSAQSADGPVTLSAIVAETTSTLIESTTTSVPETTKTESTATVVVPPTTHAPVTTAETSTTAAPITAAPTTRPTPVATAAPAPTTTAPPPTTAATTTTQSEGGYAYDDPRGTQVWLDLAQCESGGNWSINTGNGYYGGLQFSLSAWQEVGGTGYPHEHPRDTQIARGRDLQARYGWGAWPHCSEKLGLG